MGFGKPHLSTVLFILNLLALLTHTTQHLVNQAYRLWCETRAGRRTFFHDLKALTRYLLFESWGARLAFMLVALALPIPPP
jgi:hypothetical protein